MANQVKDDCGEYDGEDYAEKTPPKYDVDLNLLFPISCHTSHIRPDHHILGQVYRAIVSEVSRYQFYIITQGVWLANHNLTMLNIKGVPRKLENVDEFQTVEYLT